MCFSGDISRCRGEGLPTANSITVLHWSKETWLWKMTPAPLLPLQCGAQVWAVTSSECTRDNQTRLEWKSWGRWCWERGNVKFICIPMILSAGIQLLWLTVYLHSLVYVVEIDKTTVDCASSRGERTSYTPTYWSRHFQGTDGPGASAPRTFSSTADLHLSSAHLLSPFTWLVGCAAPMYHKTFA